jgi:cysteinyl-tRNA synthetase
MTRIGRFSWNTLLCPLGYSTLGSRRQFNTDHNDSKERSAMNMFNTLSGRVEALPTTESEASTTTSSPKGLAWYTCGPTTYAPAHLGHARTYVCLDILRRVLERQQQHTSPNVPAPLFVLNITDVDDKILTAAKETDQDPIHLARRYEQDFWKDWDALNCLRPHVVTRVTEHMDAIIVFVKWLTDKHMAYETEDGVYFHVRAYNEQLGGVTRYGKLAPPAAAEGVEIRLENAPRQPTTTPNPKKDPRDFVLWKKRKPDESLWWSSPWGEGRPGWHVECSAMIEDVQERFRDTHKFLVHAGGIDLKFPHHTNEIAQSEAFLGKGEWIPHWIHTGHLHIDGLKMSKSLKNFVTIQEFLNPKAEGKTDEFECPADDFRLWCLGLSGSYRGPATFSEARLQEARTIRHKILRFLMEGEEWIRRNDVRASTRKTWGEADMELYDTVFGAKRQALNALGDDLDGSTFLTALMTIADTVTSYVNKNEIGPVEPLTSSLHEARELLRLVGFKKDTVDAGILKNGNARDKSAIDVTCAEMTNLLVQFRSEVRNIALDTLQGSEKSGVDGMKELLRLSDQIRDVSLSELGVQLVDSKEGGKDGWKRCLPKKASTSDDNKHSICTKASNFNVHSVPLSDYFKVGTHEGSFSEFNADGFPTHNADGTEVSTRLRKKLLKKWDAHKERLKRIDATR